MIYHTRNTIFFQKKEKQNLKFQAGFTLPQTVRERQR